MQELRFVAVSEDGRYAVLGVPGRSARFTLPIDERLRAVALGQTSRLAQYEIEVESPLRPKEIQARIRAGETVDEIADAAGIAVERVRWFEGPVLAERAYLAEQAQRASVRTPGEHTPGPRLGEIVAERLDAFGSDPEDAQWDAKKRGDGSWLVELTFISGGRVHVAEWVFDPRRRHVMPADDNAARMSLPGAEPPQPATPPPGEATVTHLAPRLSTASSHAGPSHAGLSLGGLGAGGLGAGGRARHDRPGAGRPGISEPAPGAPSVSATSARGDAPPAPAPVPAEERSPMPRTAPQESARADRTADADRGNYPSAPSPAPDGRGAPGAPSGPGGRGAPGGPGGRGAPGDPGGQAPTAGPGAGDPAVPAAHEAPAASSARGPQAGPPAAAEPAGEQASRQGRKAARGKRSSVPSWDEIMFGNTRQRD